MNSIDWTWFRKSHTCLYKYVSSHKCQYQSTNQSMKSKELSADLWNRIQSKQRPEERYTTGANEHLITCKLKTFWTTRTLPRAGNSTSLSDWDRSVLVSELIKNPMVTLTDHLCSTPSMLELAERSHSSVKGTWQPTRSLPKSTWRTQKPWETKLSGLMKQWLQSLVWMPCEVETRHHHTSLAPTGKHGGGSVILWGYFWAARTGRLVRFE